MKNLKILVMLTAFVLSIHLCYGQSSSSFNAAALPNVPFNPGVDYLGWAFGVSLDLNIKNEAAQPIKFYTNAGAGSLNNLRMMIDGNSGFVGLNHSNPPGIDLSKKCV